MNNCHSIFVMTRRGMSTLIAAVLIIGFTVALAIVIMAWGGSFIDQLKEATSQQADVSISCTKVQLEIDSAIWNEDDEELKLTIKRNDASKVDITALKTKINDKPTDSLVNIDPNDLKDFSVYANRIRRDTLGEAAVLSIDEGQENTIEISPIIKTASGRTQQCPIADRERIALASK